MREGQSRKRQLRLALWVVAAGAAALAADRIQPFLLRASGTLPPVDAASMPGKLNIAAKLPSDDMGAIAAAPVPDTQRASSPPPVIVADPIIVADNVPVAPRAWVQESDAQSQSPPPLQMAAGAPPAEAPAAIDHGAAADAEHVPSAAVLPEPGSSPNRTETLSKPATLPDTIPTTKPEARHVRVTAMITSITRYNRRRAIRDLDQPPPQVQAAKMQQPECIAGCGSGSVPSVVSAAGARVSTPDRTNIALVAVAAEPDQSTIVCIAGCYGGATTYRAVPAPVKSRSARNELRPATSIGGVEQTAAVVIPLAAIPSARYRAPTSR